MYFEETRMHSYATETIRLRTNTPGRQRLRQPLRRGQKDGRQGKRAYGETSGRGYKKPVREDTARPPRVADGTQRRAQAGRTAVLILGRNAVREAIKSGRSIDRVEVVNEPDGSLREILSLARDRSLVVREVNKRHLDEICMPFGHGGKPGNHQGIVAYAAGVEYCSCFGYPETLQRRKRKRRL